MLQINSEGYMTHQLIEQIVFNCLNDEVKLRKQLQMARIAEMKQLLNIKRLEGQIQLLTVHNQQFESKLQDMVFQCERELQMPEILTSVKAQVFDKIRKIADHLAPGVRSIDVSDM